MFDILPPTAVSFADSKLIFLVLLFSFSGLIIHGNVSSDIVRFWHLLYQFLADGCFMDGEEIVIRCLNIHQKPTGD